MAEPSAAYAHRPRMVAGATVLAAAMYGEEGQAQAAALLQGRTLAAPHLVDYEMASVALKKQRRERLSETAVVAGLGLFAALAIERHAIDVIAVHSLAQRYKLTAYAASYLWLAERLEAPLATFDAALARAARDHLSDGAPDGA